MLEIEKKLDCSVIQNRQYVESEKIKIKYQKKTESADELIRQLMELLKMSLEVKEGQKIEYVLNTLETDILTMPLHSFQYSMSSQEGKIGLTRLL